MKLPAEEFISALGSDTEPLETNREIYHTYRSPEITLTFEGGETLTLSGESTSLKTQDKAYVESYTTIIGDINCNSTAAHCIASFEHTADPFKVIKIQVGSVTVWKK